MISVVPEGKGENPTSDSSPKQPDKNLLKMVKSPEKSPHQRKCIDGKWSYEKMLYVIVIRKIQIKAKMRYHSCLSDWPKSRTLTAPNAVIRIWSIRNSHSMLIEMQNFTTTLGTSLAVSYKNKHSFFISSGSCIYWFLFTQMSLSMSTQKFAHACCML